MGGDRFSDYAWDFNLDVRKRYMEKQPEKKFAVFAHNVGSRVPARLEKVPDHMLVIFTETSTFWMLPHRMQEPERRNEWIKKMSKRDLAYLPDPPRRSKMVGTSETGPNRRGQIV